VVPSARTRGNAHTLKHWRFPLNIRRATKSWNRLPSKVVSSPSLKTFKNYVDMALGSQL